MAACVRASGCWHAAHVIDHDAFPAGARSIAPIAEQLLAAHVQLRVPARARDAMGASGSIIRGRGDRGPSDRAA
jgi:hypothetical protein